MKSRLGRVIFASSLIALAFLGCETRTKHEVLSFFFDGVPPLETLKPEAVLETQAPAGARRVKAPQSVLFTHKPYEERKCASCHDLIQGNRADTRASLCFRCHEDDKTTGKVVHAPVAGGECLICHAPHQSGFKSLLPSTPPDLCLNCHDQAELDNVGPHSLIGDRLCTACHDPHSSDSPALMVFADGGQVCFDCHQSSNVLSNRMTHQPAKEGQCGSCHVSHSQGGKAHLVREGKALCDECHQVPEKQAAIVHAPVATGACLVCHDPHGSPITPLLIEEQPELCWQCHNEEPMTGKEEHAAASEDNFACTRCHSPHSSMKVQLLK